MYGLRVFCFIALLAGAEVAKLNTLSEFEGHRRSQHRLQYEHFFDSNTLPEDPAAIAAADADWAERNSVCKMESQCLPYDFPHDFAKGEAEVPCEPRPLPGDHSLADKCRLGDMYMMETPERTREFLKMRTLVLLARAMKYEEACNTKELQETEECARMGEEIAQATSFLGKAKSTLSESADPADLALVAEGSLLEKVMVRAGSALMLSAGLPQQDMVSLQELIRDARAMGPEVLKGKSMAVAENMVLTVLKILDGDKSADARKKIRAKKALTPTREQEERAKNAESSGAEIGETTGMSGLLKAESQIYADVATKFDEQEAEIKAALLEMAAGESSLLQEEAADRSCDSEGSEAAGTASAASAVAARRSEALRGRSGTMGGVIFTLAFIGVLAFLCFFFGWQVLPWIGVYILSAIVLCGLFKLGYGIYRSFRHDKEVEEAWQKEKERRSKMPQARAKGMMAAMGLAKKEKEVAATPDYMTRRAGAGRASSARFARDGSQKGSGSWAAPGGSARAAPAESSNPFKKVFAPEPAPAPEPEQDWGQQMWGGVTGMFGGGGGTVSKEDHGRRMATARAESATQWNALRQQPTKWSYLEMGADESSAVSSQGIWGKCTWRFITFPFWIVWKAGTLTWKLFDW